MGVYLARVYSILLLKIWFVPKHLKPSSAFRLPQPPTWWHTAMKTVPLRREKKLLKTPRLGAKAYEQAARVPVYPAGSFPLYRFPFIGSQLDCIVEIGELVLQIGHRKFQGQLT